MAPSAATIAKYERAWTRHVGRRKLAAFERGISDPELVSMRQELVKLDLRIDELEERAKQHESRGSWARVKQLTGDLDRELEKETPDLNRIKDTRRELVEVTTGRLGDYSLWDDITALIEQRRRISDTERKFEELHQLLIPAARLSLLFDDLHHAIETVIPDRGIQLQLLQELRVRLNGDPRAPRQLLPASVLPTAYDVHPSSSDASGSDDQAVGPESSVTAVSSLS